MRLLHLPQDENKTILECMQLDVQSSQDVHFAKGIISEGFTAQATGK